MRKEFSLFSIYISSIIVIYNNYMQRNIFKINTDILNMGYIIIIIIDLESPPESLFTVT